MEPKIKGLAAHAASKAAGPGSGRVSRYVFFRDEFEQVARIAVWEATPRFAGSTVDDFFGFVHRTVETRLCDSVRDERIADATGADADAYKTFGKMVMEADGDVYLAEQMAQRVPPAGKRLSRDRANAARLAWQGRVSLDAPVSASAYALDRTDYWTTPMCNTLPGSMPIPGEDLDADDINSEERRVRRSLVHSVLHVMGKAQATVLRCTFGIEHPVAYGRGDSGDDAGLAAEIGSTVARVRDAREKGLKAFAKRYIKVAAVGRPAYAAELTDAAAKELSRGGRK